MLRSRKRVMIAVGIAAALVLIVGLTLAVVYPFWYPIIWRRESVLALKNANEEAAARAAVNMYGAFVPIKDGSWIAIRYNDSHSGGIRSLAIARDSGGKWFESTHHYCGELRFVDLWMKAQAQPPEVRAEMPMGDTPLDDLGEEMRPLMLAQNLEEARKAILAAGFSPME